MKLSNVMNISCALIALSPFIATKGVSASIASDEGYTSKATLTIPPGNLSLETVEKNLDFGNITLSNKNQLISKPGQITVADYTTQFAGWNVQVKKADVKWDNHLALAIKEKNKRLNKDFQPFQTQVAGNYDVYQPLDFDAYLTVPSNVKPDNYATKVVWSLVQGPER